MAEDDVSVWGGSLKVRRTPATGEILLGNGSNFTLTDVGLSVSGGVVNLSKPLTVNGIVKSTSGGFTFPDNTTQTSAATSYAPPSVATGTIQSNISGGTTAPSANTISSVLDNLLGTTQGSVAYRGASSWSALAPGTSGQYLQTAGASANPAWASVPVPDWTLVKKTSDQVITSSSSFTNDTALQFAMAANTTYAIKVYMSITASTGGFQLGMNGPASPTKVRISPPQSVGSMLALSYNSLVINGGSGVWMVTIMASIINGANAGTLAVRICQNSSSASATTFEKGSWLEYAIIA